MENRGGNEKGNSGEGGKKVSQGIEGPNRAVGKGGKNFGKGPAGPWHGARDLIPQKTQRWSQGTRGGNPPRALAKRKLGGG